MDINLYRVSKVCWAVTHPLSDTQVFKSIEDASVFLESLGIADETIDLALIEMVGNDHSRATFNSGGKLVSTDNARLNELLGVA